ncbi:MAG: DUF1573 domain-containing protein [Cytophagia bacterium]|nr:MAG: DUF1573 domain-containing protein [Cytophagia bacterium]TAG43696.1 MAG: DUF1573 domain-containing protein [Cytophagia bacterium]
MKKIFLLTIVLMSVNWIFAQNNNPTLPLIKFQKLEHNFGNIKEDGGVAEYNFEFTNISKQPIKLSGVQASCGCTTPKWSKEPVGVNQKGIVTAAFDPNGRVGIIDKTVTVTIEGQSTPIILMIKGNVVAKVKGIKDYYPSENGSLRFSAYNFYFEKILHDGQAKQKMTIYNQSDKEIVMNVEETKKLLPPHIQFIAQKSSIPAKDSIKVEVIFDASKQKDWDYVFHTLQLFTNDAALDAQGKSSAVKNLYVNGKVVENFGNLTNETKLPMAKFDRVAHNFGNINQNPNNKTLFKLTNNGQANLIIRQSKASCGCTLGKVEKTTLAPSESTNFEVVFSTVGKPAGPQTQTLTVITNDPANPRTELRIEANVLVDDKKTTSDPTNSKPVLDKTQKGK